MTFQLNRAMYIKIIVLILIPINFAFVYFMHLEGYTRAGWMFAGIFTTAFVTYFLIRFQEKVEVTETEIRYQTLFRKKNVFLNEVAQITVRKVRYKGNRLTYWIVLFDHNQKERLAFRADLFNYSRKNAKEAISFFQWIQQKEDVKLSASLKDVFKIKEGELTLEPSIPSIFKRHPVAKIILVFAGLVLLYMLYLYVTFTLL